MAKKAPAAAKPSKNAKKTGNMTPENVLAKVRAPALLPPCSLPPP